MMGLNHGYVVLRGRPWGSPEYVFRALEDARRWQHANGLEHCPIKRVLSESSFRWRWSTGSIKKLELADHRFEIYPDRRFSSGEYRAFLAESEFLLAQAS